MELRHGDAETTNVAKALDPDHARCSRGGQAFPTQFRAADRQSKQTFDHPLERIRISIACHRLRAGQSLKTATPP